MFQERLRQPLIPSTLAAEQKQRPTAKEAQRRTRRATLKNVQVKNILKYETKSIIKKGTNHIGSTYVHKRHRFKAEIASLHMLLMIDSA